MVACGCCGGAAVGALVEVEFVAFPGQDNKGVAIGGDREAESLVEGLRARHVADEDFRDELRRCRDVAGHQHPHELRGRARQSSSQVVVIRSRGWMS